MNQIILLEKQSPASSSWQYLVKHKKLSQFSVQETVDKYKGFEGDIIFYNFIDNESCNIFGEYESLIKQNESKKYHLLCACTDEFFLPESKFEKAGYDFGICEEDYTIYSSIFNEILFGNIEELINFKYYLNENLLFQNRELANEYAILHHNLLIKNVDVEHDEHMQTYEIWKYRN